MKRNSVFGMMMVLVLAFTGIVHGQAHRLPSDLQAARFPATGKAFGINENYMLSWGATVPTDAATGYENGCIFIHTDGSGINDVVYVNAGSETSCNFDAITLGSSLTDAYIFVGNASNVATGVAVSGDVTIANTGAVTIATGAVEDSMIEALTSGQIIIGVDGTAANNAKVTVSGDATLANDGTLTIATGAVEDSMIEGLAAGQIILGVDGTAANNLKAVLSGDVTMDATGAVTIATGAVEDSMIEALTDGQFIIGVDGTAANNAKVTMSGDATLANNGALTIATGAVEDSMIEALTAGQFIIGVDGTAANNAKVVMSGDATMDATGAVTIATGAVEDSMIEGLADGAIIVGTDGTAANNGKVTVTGDVTMANTGVTTANTSIKKKYVYIHVEDLAADADISVRPVFVVPEACVLDSIGILTEGSSAGVDDSNTMVVTLADDGTNTIVTKTYNTGTQPPASDYADLGALDGTHKDLAAGEHVTLSVTNGTSANPPAFTIVIVFTPDNA